MCSSQSQLSCFETLLKKFSHLRGQMAGLLTKHFRLCTSDVLQAPLQLGRVLLSWDSFISLVFEETIGFVLGSPS